MSDATYFVQYTNCLEAVGFHLRFVGAGAAAVPTFIEGDGGFVTSTGTATPTSTGNEWVLARTSTGVLTMKSVNPWAGCYEFSGGLFLASADSTNTSGVQVTALPSQDATTHLWTFNFNVYVAATLTDLASTQNLWLSIYMRNELTSP